MIRAEQTAGAILPKKGVNTVVVDPYLAESSDAASGKNILQSTDDAGGVIMNTAVQVASVTGLLDKRANQKQQAEAAIVGKVSGVKTSGSQDATLIEDDKKVAHIHDKINQMAPNSTWWMIGHGKLAKKFLQDELGLKDADLKDKYKDETSFAFGETKKIIYYTDEKGGDCAFLPPYSLVANQKTGRLEAKIVQSLNLQVKYDQAAQQYVALVTKIVTNEQLWKGTYVSDRGISSFFGVNKLMKPPLISKIAEVCDSKKGWADKQVAIIELLQAERNNPDPHNQHPYAQGFIAACKFGRDGLIKFAADKGLDSASSAPTITRKNS